MRPFYKNNTGELYNEHCLNVLAKMKDRSIGIIITSPPYNMGANGMGRGNTRALGSKIYANKKYDKYNDNMRPEQYFREQQELISECIRVLVDGGALFYNHKNRIQDGNLINPWEIVRDFPVRQEIIWQRTGGINFTRRHFLPTYEKIYLIPKGDFSLSSGSNLYGDIWKYHQVENEKNHPCPFPIGIPKRIIASVCSEKVGEYPVMDPFMGSGTTAVAAIEMGRQWVGCETSTEYCKLIKDRCSSVTMPMFSREEMG